MASSQVRLQVVLENPEALEAAGRLLDCFNDLADLTWRGEIGEARAALKDLLESVVVVQAPAKGHRIRVIDHDEDQDQGTI